MTRFLQTIFDDNVKRINSIVLRNKFQQSYTIDKYLGGGGTIHVITKKLVLTLATFNLTQWTKIGKIVPQLLIFQYLKISFTLNAAL